MKLYRVYTLTQGDTAVTERLVAADDDKQAAAQAVGNVKAQNPTKGLTSVSESQANTVVLSVREAGSDGVLCVSRIPVNAIEVIAHAINPKLADCQALLDQADDILRLADLPPGEKLAEAITILEARLGKS